MLIITIVVFLAVIWRSVAIYRYAAPESGQSNMPVFKTYVTPVSLLTFIAVAVGYAIPLSTSPVGALADLRRIFIVMSHISYVAIFGALVFFIATRKKRNEVSNLIWSMVVNLVALLLLLILSFVASNYNGQAYGSYFEWNAQTTSRVASFYCISTAIILSIVRSFRFRRYPNTKLFIYETWFIALAIIVRILGATFGYFSPGIEPYTWL